MSTRHSFQAGHPPGGPRSRVAEEVRVSRGSPANGAFGSARSIRPSATLSPGRPGLRALLDAWDRLAGPIAEDRLRAGLRDLRIDRHALWDCIRFDDRRPQRTRIRGGDHYEALVVCWRSGQRSPIQDHGGSTCGVLVVEGAATEIGFMTTPSGLLAPSRSQRIEAGAAAVFRPRDVYQLANLESATTEMVSLHVYSPPRAQGRRRRLAETTFADLDGLEDDPSTVASAPV